MKDYVIFSAIVGNYDTVHQPLVVDERFDYILFSNNICGNNIGIWKIQPIPFNHTDPTRIARYVKTHPETLLPNHSYSIWVDASVQILAQDFYDKILTLTKTHTLICTNNHPYRNCVYDEMFVVMQHSLEKENVVLSWGQFLRKRHYPRNNGLFETNILFRYHADPSVMDFDNRWWKCISEYSRRDQLSFVYVLWKTNIRPSIFYNDLRKANSICYHYHESSYNRSISDDCTPLMRQCRPWPTNGFKTIKRLYYFSYLFPNPQIILYVGYYVREILHKITKGYRKYQILEQS